MDSLECHSQMKTPPKVSILMTICPIWHAHKGWARAEESLLLLLLLLLPLLFLSTNGLNGHMWHVERKSDDRGHEQKENGPNISIDMFQLQWQESTWSFRDQYSRVSNYGLGFVFHFPDMHLHSQHGGIIVFTSVNEHWSINTLLKHLHHATVCTHLCIMNALPVPPQNHD